MDTGVEADGWATRWVEPLADLAAGTTTALVPDVIVTALALGLTHRYVGRTVATDVHGVPVRATVRSVQVRRRRAHLQSRVELAAVDWGGRRVDEVTVVAHGVRVVPGIRTRFSAHRLDVQGTSGVGTVLDWLNSLRHDWVFVLDRDGSIRATHRRRRLTALVDITVTDGVARIELGDARCYGVPVPGRLLPPRDVALPPLPGGAGSVCAAREGHLVRFAMQVPAVSYAFDPLGA
ncbi:hypothetical protein ACWPOB_16920 [Rhodococcus sp. 2H158]